MSINEVEVWNAYVKRRAIDIAYDAYKEALDAGWTEEQANELFNDVRNEYLNRNLE